MYTQLVDLDQCMYGLNVDGTGRNLKPTRIATNKTGMRLLARKCDGTHSHTRLLGSDRTSKAENYPEELALRIATLMTTEDVAPSKDVKRRDILPVEEDSDVTMKDKNDDNKPTIQDEQVYAGQGLLQRQKELKCEAGERVYNYVQKVHRGMGHPSASTMVKTFENSNASEVVIWCARWYECATCADRAPPPTAAKSTTIKATNFNQRVQMDVFYIQHSDERYKIAILHIVDVATRFAQARVVLAETGEDFVKALMRSWITPYGPPQTLQYDEARPFCGAELTELLERHNIKSDVAPGEAHFRLGIIERRHMTLRTALENYLTDLQTPANSDTVRDALEHVVPSMNNLSFTKGYTPSQWVLNTTPTDPSSVTSDDFCPTVQHDALHDPTFADQLEKRMFAKMAFVKADADDRIRRALLRRHRTLTAPLSVGQHCFYRRESGAPRLRKSRWRGPATVVMIEYNHNKPVTYWLVHATNLIRCAPEHVKPEIKSEGNDIASGLEEAKKQVQEIRGRSTTLYQDLRKQGPPAVDDDSDGEDGEAERPQAGPQPAARPRQPPPPQPQPQEAQHDNVPPPPPPPWTPEQDPPAQVEEPADDPSAEIAPEPEEAQQEPEQEQAAEPTSAAPEEVPVPSSPVLTPATAPPIPPLESDFVKRRRLDEQSETAWFRRPDTTRGQHVIEDVLLSDITLEYPEFRDWKCRDETLVLELSERNMTVAERTQFAAAKRKELQQFFENNVWVYASEHDPTRTMKARFLLKWRETEDGTKEAKARLVLQGFNDPDALEGKLETSSPTGSRIARQLLLLTAANESWTLEAADVKAAFLQGNSKTEYSSCEFRTTQPSCLALRTRHT